MIKLIPSLLPLTLMCLTITHAQDEKNNEHGIGFVSTMVPEPITVWPDTLPSSKPIAVLQSDSIWFLHKDFKVATYDRALEIMHNDEYGLPILGFNRDSMWVKVSLDCRSKHNPPFGWINCRWSQIPVYLWRNYFRQGAALYFLDRNSIAFYSAPDTSKPFRPNLVGGYSKPDYCLRVKQVVGDWMQVDLETPSTFMVDPEDTADLKVKRYQVWVRFISANKQLQVWQFQD